MEHTNNEKNILAAIEFPFLVNLLAYWKDNYNLYMSMEVCQRSLFFLSCCTHSLLLFLPSVCLRWRTVWPSQEYWPVSGRAGPLLRWPDCSSPRVSAGTQHNIPVKEQPGRFPASLRSAALPHLTIVWRMSLQHSDLKPENLLFDQHGYLKITDFGFAK